VLQPLNRKRRAAGYPKADDEAREEHEQHARDLHWREHVPPDVRVSQGEAKYRGQKLARA